MKFLVLIFAFLLPFYDVNAEKENKTRKDLLPFYDVNAEKENKTQDLRLIVVTVATKETDGYRRFMRSCQIYGIDVKVLGLNEKCGRENRTGEPDGGHKLNLLKGALQEYKDDNNTIIMFTDSSDFIFMAGADEIIKKFLKFEARVVFSAEDVCWPDKVLESKYSTVPVGYRFLCSGGIIGYAPALNNIANYEEVGNILRIYLKHKDEFKIKFDHKSEIVQNLNSNSEDVELTFGTEDVKLSNTYFQTVPAVVHDSGPGKWNLNNLGNYLAKSWTFHNGCMKCKENTFNLRDLKEENYPRILLNLFIEKPTPFVPSYLERVAQLDYPKNKIDVFIHNIDAYHVNDVNHWQKKYGEAYASVEYYGPHNLLKEQEARNKGLHHCKKVNCDYVFVIDADVTLTNRNALRLLMEQNRTILAPMMSKHGKLWTNFWGAIRDDGYYARADDYLDIVRNNRLGVWNSPFMSKIYLIKSSILPQIKPKPFHSEYVDADMAFSKSLRDEGLFMHVTNLEYFGHVKETNNYKTDRIHNDMYELFDNRLDWEDRFIHENYTKYLQKTQPVPEPCTDVFWFPFMSTDFTIALIEEMEYFGQWSGGKNEDLQRLAVDIHLKEIGFEKHWLSILKDYITPMAKILFEGYSPESRAIMNFVVKYKTNGQYFHQPHHDYSTFTINVALNRPGIDYEGGGSRFLRYNCTAPPSRRGWTIMHPGRLTHYHEGSKITQGTRYIMVSFIDP